MEYTSHIDELIAKRLTGEISAEETAVLDNWLGESTENRSYFRQMQQVWQQSQTARLVLPRPIDVEASLAKTKAKIHANAGRGAAKIVRMRYEWMGVAATILLLVGAFWFFQRSESATPVMLAATDKTLRDTLSDGSMVALNRFSSLQAEFSGKSRRIKMQGEAYFEVAHDTSKPFVVEVKKVEVTVVGTKFNIDNRRDSNTVIVSVEEGRVKVQIGAQVVFLNAGERASIDCETGQIVRGQLAPSGNVTAWANHQFVFDDVPVSEILPLLESAYGVNIRLANKELENSRLHVRFNNEPIEQVIAVIAETLCVEIKNINGQYLLDGPGCDH